MSRLVYSLAHLASLPFAVPAAAAGLAYINARHGLFEDLGFLSRFISSNISTDRLEKRDELSLFYVLEEHAQSSPNHPFIICNGKTWTYAQSYEIVLKYGTWLKSRGVVKDEIVAMDFVNSEIFIWIWLGLWSIGAKPAFINYNLTGKSLIHTIRTSTARLVLVDQHGKDNFSEHVMAEHGFVARPSEESLPGRHANYGFDRDPSQVPSVIEKSRTGAVVPQGQTSAHVSAPIQTRRKLEIVFFDQALESHIFSLAPTRLPNSERSGQKRSGMAMLIYTSGTTGLPKPAVMSWGKIHTSGNTVKGWIPLKKNDIMYTAMPLYHSSAAVLCVAATIRAGSTFALGRKFSHSTFWPDVRASKATIIQYVGETCRYLLSAPESPLDKDHNVRIALGNGLRPDVWQPFKDRFNIKTVCEFYAATEAPIGFFNRNTNNFSTGAIGRQGTLVAALMGRQVALVRMDPESDPPEPLRDLDTGLCQIANGDEPGEMLYELDPKDISAKFQGYFGNDKATKSKILRNVKAKGDAYFRSGDLMKWDEENRIWFLDRTGDTFRWKAENVSTAEGDGKTDVSGAPLALPSAQSLKHLADHLKKALPGFAVPLFLRVTKTMQTTGTNKQQKHLLQKDGIEIDVVEASGDALFWLKEGTYQRFTRKDLDKIRGGQVRL
ncbi:acetyl-CoA synthetase-like protein [Pleomassaria siparia CBS 279.74]|uniref:Very long-chain fatty acid transport protein n=1 Tax=Pleomassaria siparia CBS 279.74 TaxID=1314801 RepID=A0A6G1KB48_9PLEO|nr:acetyl-CoA synthetase-like protein [Pleomassaria siparia CBS 279.74]